MKAVLAALILAPAVALAAGEWGQCGGQGFTGDTSCPSGWVCSVSNQWYSQCIQGTGGATTTQAPVTTTTTRTTTTQAPVTTTQGQCATTTVTVPGQTVYSTVTVTSQRPTTTTTTTTRTTTTTTQAPQSTGNLPNNFSWTSSGMLVSPKADSGHNAISVKDPSIVYVNGAYHIYATSYTSNKGYNMFHTTFTDFANAPNAVHFYLDQVSGLSGYKCAPQVFYFPPQNKWYLMYQTPNPTFSTTTDVTNPRSWSGPSQMITTMPSILNSEGSWIDFWVICDDSNCHLFYSNDKGDWFRQETTKSAFPYGWGSVQHILNYSNAGDAFEGSAVYKLKGQTKYLAIIECMGSTGRWYKAWTATSLRGPWTNIKGSESDPWAGMNNVQWPAGKWVTGGISHGELIRDSNTEYMEIDPCNLRFLYQGMNGNTNVEYNNLPYRLGLITQTNKGSGC